MSPFFLDQNHVDGMHLPLLQVVQVMMRLMRFRQLRRKIEMETNSSMILRSYCCSGQTNSIAQPVRLFEVDNSVIFNDCR